MTSLAKFEQSDDDDEDEHFSDAHCSDDDNHNDESVQNGVMTNKTTESEKSTVITDKSNVLLTSSWYHRSLKKQRNTRNIFNYGYNPTVRDPKFAQATGCLLWSLSLLSKHIHPTINLFANSLLNNLPIQYTGDPFTDFGLMHFLDRFAYKKPKLNKLKETKSTTEEPIQSMFLFPECSYIELLSLFLTRCYSLNSTFYFSGNIPYKWVSIVLI